MNIQEVNSHLMKEQEDLLLLAQKMGISVNSVISPQQTIKDLALNEIELEKLQLMIRSSWQEKSFLRTRDIFKSPPEDEKIQTNSNREIVFGYERTIQVPDFEKELHKEDLNYTGFSLIYSSAMSGYLSVITALSKIFKKKGTTKAGFIGGYFESVFLTQDMSNNYFQVFHLADEKNINKLNFTELDALIVEPVKYNFNLDKTDLKLIIKHIGENKSKEKVLFLILDTTLLGEAFPINDVLKLCSSIENLIVINIRSCLKLHQEGFEFTNGGLISIYFDEKLKSIQDKLFTFMQSQRGILGTNLSLYEYCLIDNNFFKNSLTYTNQIHENTKHLYQNIKIPKDSIISEVIYPNKDGKTEDLHKVPFIFIKLKTKNEEDYLNFIEYLRSKLNEYKLNIPLRNSFGFRNICLQFIKSVENNQKLVIKIAPGKLRGVKHFLLIEILNELAKYHHLEILGDKKELVKE